MELDCKYVLHIPLIMWENGKLRPLDVDGQINELISCLELKGFDGFYVTKVESHYKSRKYDELLITIFACGDDTPLPIFRHWFFKNNHILSQEAMAYEMGNKMIIEPLKK